MAEKKIPNPNGRKGSPEHQQKIDEIAKEIEKRGLFPTVEKIIRTLFGKKKCRFVDIAATDADDNLIELHQVGRKNKNGLPVKRERDAISDIERSEDSESVKVQFHNYQKVILVLILVSSSLYILL